MSFFPLNDTNPVMSPDNTDWNVNPEWKQREEEELFLPKKNSATGEPFLNYEFGRLIATP